MTQEEKDLLLKDLCARLPYGVKINVNGEEDTLLELGVDTGWVNASYDIKEVRSYLRPMSSMTEEEQVELGRLIGTASYNMLKGNMSHLDALLVHIYKNHIDVFGLINQGLALEAPEGMYKLKEK